MANDPYKATWVSHSSIGDFLKCPRAYYLHNVYKDPKTRRKINIVNPALSLGIAVHEVLENLANFKSEERFNRSLFEDLEKAWKKVEGIKGGFSSKEEELETKERAREMIKKVSENPEPLKEKTIKIKGFENGLPPNFYLSEEDNIILCGKIDWLIWKPEDDSVHILDFKTGKNEESGESLQLPIYELLLKNLQKRKVTGASYWYLDKDEKPTEVKLIGLDESFEKVYGIAKKIKEAREKKEFECPRGDKGCFACRPFEDIIKGNAKFIGVGEMNQDLYML